MFFRVRPSDMVHREKSLHSSKTYSPKSYKITRIPNQHDRVRVSAAVAIESILLAAAFGRLRALAIVSK